MTADPVGRNDPLQRALRLATREWLERAAPLQLLDRRTVAVEQQRGELVDAGLQRVGGFDDARLRAAEQARSDLETDGAQDAPGPDVAVERTLVPQVVGRPGLLEQLRIGVAAVFLYASLDKIAHPQAFAQATYNYRLLPLPLLIWKFWRRPHGATDAYTHGDRSTLLHPALGRLASTFIASRSLTHAGSRLHILTLVLLWILLVLALMRPQWLEPYTEVRTEGYDLMLAVDTSRSMEALDFTVNNAQVTRMAVLKGVLNKFIANRGGDRVGLIIFGKVVSSIDRRKAAN